MCPRYSIKSNKRAVSYYVHIFYFSGASGSCFPPLPTDFVVDTTSLAMTDQRVREKLFKRETLTPHDRGLLATGLYLYISQTHNKRYLFLILNKSPTFFVFYIWPSRNTT